MGITYITLDDPSALEITRAYDINNNEQLVGYYSDSNGARHGFLYDENGWVSFDHPSGIGRTVAYGINDLGHIVGLYTSGPDNETASQLSLQRHELHRARSSFCGRVDQSLWHQRRRPDRRPLPRRQRHLSRLSYDGGGGGSWTSFDHPFGAQGTYALGINEAGQIVGYYLDGNGRHHGFLYDGVNFSRIDHPLGTTGSVAYGINDAGQIVGYYADVYSENHGFLYNLNTGTFTNLDDPLGTNGTLAQAINDAGQIAGYFIDGNNLSHSFYSIPTADWLTGVSGDFGNAANWSPATVPGWTYGAAISASGSTPSRAPPTREVESLSTAAGATLDVVGGTFTVEYGTGSEANAGTIMVRPAQPWCSRARSSIPARSGCSAAASRSTVR